jgi:hypothetical protein
MLQPAAPSSGPNEPGWLQPQVASCSLELQPCVLRLKLPMGPPGGRAAGTQLGFPQAGPARPGPGRRCPALRGAGTRPDAISSFPPAILSLRVSESWMTRMPRAIDSDIVSLTRPIHWASPLPPLPALTSPAGRPERAPHFSSRLPPAGQPGASGPESARRAVRGFGPGKISGPEAWPSSGAVRITGVVSDGLINTRVR